MTFYSFSYVFFVCEYGCVWLFHEPWHASGSQDNFQEPVLSFSHTDTYGQTSGLVARASNHWAISLAQDQ